MIKNAYFAGGCFWCITPVFKIYRGVISVEAGYCGGKEINPKYEDVKAQKTSHRETIKVSYDDELIEYSKLLEIYLNNVDVHDKDGQYIDRGHSYTLAIYYMDELEHKIITERLNKYKEKVYISIEPYDNFYKAEEYHQDYYLKHPKEFEQEMIKSGRK